MKVRRNKAPRIGEAQAAMSFLYNPEPPKMKKNPGPLSITFTYTGQPVAAKRARVTQRGTFNPAAYTQYKRALAIAIRIEFGHLIPEVPPAGSRARSQYIAAHRYRLIVEAYRADRRPVDGDNLAKTVLDALQESGLLLNDCMVDELMIRKHVDPSAPRLSFMLEELDRGE
jgi:Holliday junction resolvase RusA-like endonuclease